MQTMLQRSETHSDGNRTNQKQIAQMTCLPSTLRLLLSDDGKDWGQFSGEVTLLPLPRIKPEGLELLRQEKVRLLEVLTPAPRKKAALHLAKLRARYAEREISKTALRALVAEDLDDIADYPEYLIERACRNWRNDPENKWAPRAMAQLMKTVNDEYFEMKKQLKRIGILLERA